MKKRVFLSVIMVTVLSVCILAHAENAQNSEAEKYREVMQMTKEAVTLLLEKGRDGLAEISDPKGKWVKGDLYVFVYGLKGAERGVIIGHPRQGLVGKNFLRVRDRNGKIFAAEFLRIAESESGEGWSEYWWPRLEGSEPEPKLSYIANVPGKDMLAGVGIHGGHTLEEAMKLLNP
ncbi:MAG: cache domain-containing protein [Desulfobacterales bacterium]